MALQGSNADDYRVSGFTVPRPSNRRTTSDPPAPSSDVPPTEDGRESSTSPRATISDEGSASPGPSAGDSGTEGAFENSPSNENGQRGTKAPSLRQRTAQACDKCRERKTKCSGHRPVCIRCTNRGLICEYSARESRVRSIMKSRPVPPFQVNYTGGSADRPTPAYRSRLGHAQTHAYERAAPPPSLVPPPAPVQPYKAPAVGRMQAPPPRGLIVPQRGPGGSGFGLHAVGDGARAREMGLGLEQGHWDMSPTQAQAQATAMNNSFERRERPPAAEGSSSSSSSSAPYALGAGRADGRGKERNVYAYDYMGRYVPADHPSAMAGNSNSNSNSNGSVYDELLAAPGTGAPAGAGLGLGDLSFQHFLTQVNERLWIHDVLLTLLDSDNSGALLDPAQQAHQQKQQQHSGGDSAPHATPGGAFSYPLARDVDLSEMDMAHYVGASAKEGVMGFRAPPRYDSMSGYPSWDAAGDGGIQDADFGAAFGVCPGAYGERQQQQQQQQQEMAHAHAIRGFGAPDAQQRQQQHQHQQHQHQQQQQQQQQGELELMCPTPGMAIGAGAYGLHSPHQSHVGAYPAEEGFHNAGMYSVPSSGGGSGAHDGALSVPLLPPGSRFGEYNFFK